MYLTTQHVRAPYGMAAEVHSFLHLHDQPQHPFPANPLHVPQYSPGRLVRAWPPQPQVHPGGNDVISYVDIIVQDYLWSPHWLVPIRAGAAVLYQWALPAVFRFGPVYVVYFVANRVNEVQELQTLIDWAAHLLVQPAAIVAG